MRLAKKFGVIVAMAAVCLTMAAPTTANAGTCPPHYFSVYDTDQEITTSTHKYVYSITKHPDGSIEKHYDYCTVTVEKIYSNSICLNCSLKKRELTSESDSHSDDCGED